MGDRDAGLDTLLSPVACPYCGEVVELVLDVSAGSQSYVEDCEVCCRPMIVRVRVDRRGEVRVEATHEDA